MIISLHSVENERFTEGWSYIFSTAWTSGTKVYGLVVNTWFSFVCLVVWWVLNKFNLDTRDPCISLDFSPSNSMQ